VIAFSRALSQLESEVCAMPRGRDRAQWREAISDALLELIHTWEENHENREAIWRRMSDSDAATGKRYRDLIRCELNLLADCHRFRRAIREADNAGPLKDAILTWITACRAVEQILDASLLDFHRAHSAPEAV
jgi:hypothetical protein